MTRSKIRKGERNEWWDRAQWLQFCLACVYLFGCKERKSNFKLEQFDLDLEDRGEFLKNSDRYMIDTGFGL